MITKDISLEACILDLLDNSLDGAREHLRGLGGDPAGDEAFAAYAVELTITPDLFEITDNCGGISIADAVDYAFHFGRRPGAEPEQGGIGLYGIGMKRAVFKLGVQITVASSTAAEAFVVPIDVKEWLNRIPWDFELAESPVADVGGTTITVSEMYPSVAAEFADPEFAINLIRTVGRDYSFYLQKGFSVKVNGTAVRPYIFEVREATGSLEPAVEAYIDDGVNVRIIAGLASLPQEEIEPGARPVADPRYFGWFVICNDRVVLAADKTAATVWGHEGFPMWHPQYNGFMGLCFFSAADPSKLPWTTTKRGVDSGNPVYRRAVARMKQLSRLYTSYTDRRKEVLDLVRPAETEATAVAVTTLFRDKEMLLPAIPQVPRVRLVSIQYKRPVAEVTRVAAALGSRTMAARDVGEKTYEFYLQNYVEDGD